MMFFFVNQKQKVRLRQPSSNWTFCFLLAIEWI